MDKLKEIWTLSAKTNPANFMIADEFFVAMRLIAYCQNNMKCNEEYVLTDV